MGKKLNIVFGSAALCQSLINPYCQIYKLNIMATSCIAVYSCAVECEKYC